MKKLLIAYLFISSFFCMPSFAQEHEFTPFKAVQRAEPLEDDAVKNKISEMYLTGENNINPDVVYDIANAEFLTFADTDIQGALLKEEDFAIGTSKNHMLLVYLKDRAVADMAMQYFVNRDESENTVCTITDHEGQEFAYVTIRPDSVIIENNPDWKSPSYGKTDFNSNSLHMTSLQKGGPNFESDIIYNNAFRSWWDRWTSCAASAFNSLVTGQGSVKRSSIVAGVACMAIGKICAAAFVVGCAAHATYYN